MTFEYGTGEAFLNAIRAAAFVTQPVLRPVGFKVGNASNVLAISDNVEEDMTTFISNVCSGIFATNSDNEAIEVTAVCDGELTMSQMLHGSGVQCDRDFPVLHSLSPVEVSVVFRKDKGTHYSDENQEFLKSRGFSHNVAINSRHCNLESFTFKRVDEEKNKETFEITIVTNDGESPKVLLDNAMRLFAENFKIIQSYL